MKRLQYVHRQQVYWKCVFFCGFKRNLHQWIGTLHCSLDKSAILLGTLVSMPQRLSINPVEQKTRSRMGYYLKVKGRQFLLNYYGDKQMASLTLINGKTVERRLSIFQLKS